MNASSSCTSCGYALEPGSAFCWGCGKSDPLKGAAKTNSASSPVTKVVLIAVGALAFLAMAITAVTIAITSIQGGFDQEVIQPTPTPEPSEDSEDGISKQNGNA